MATHDIIMAAAGAAGATEANYIEDCFSCYLYTGTGASQTITNGIDLSTNGGMVWLKSRSYVANNYNFDTARGAGKNLITNLTQQEATSASQLTSFNTNGFSLGLNVNVNTNAETYSSWTFRKQAKFFDVVTYTGDGTSNRSIAHSLGATPGMIIVKRTDATQAWVVYHNAIGNTGSLQLASTSAATTSSTTWNNTSPTSTQFTVGTNAASNASGGTYVAYLFADSNSGGFGAAGTDSVVACGSFTTDGSGAATVSLGWEPQYLLVKKSNGSGTWIVLDAMRGWSMSTDSFLQPNTSDAENVLSGTTYSLDLGNPTATGFSIKNIDASGDYIYLAIRRGPMKTPTDATKVFAPVARVGTGTTNTITSSFPVDLSFSRLRTPAGNTSIFDRLRGADRKLISQETSAEQAGSGSDEVIGFDLNDGVRIGSSGNVNASGFNYANWLFRRAPGFFDIVCYTGDGNTGFRFFEHNLGAIPQLLIVKSRSGSGNWYVADSILYGYMFLNSTSASTLNPPSTGEIFASSSTLFGTTGQFNGNNVSGVNASGQTYVAYLFATCPGVSKVGSYTGSSTTKQIDCGFASGARFVLIKRTDSTGDWYVWDTARGLVSGNDPYLLLNSTAAEVTNTDYIDPYSAGFEISSSAPAAINASGGTFIYLAIA